MLIDTHAHLTKSSEEDNVERLLRAQNAGLEAIVNISTTPFELYEGLKLQKEVPWIYNAAATTPHDSEKLGETDFPLFVAEVKNLVAIGETGLDYHYTHSAPEIQRHFLRRYIQLAVSVQLPLIFHCREAFEDLFKIFDEECKGKWPPFILHCFTGTLKEGEEVLKRGGHLSFSGIVTFKKSEELRQVAKMCPLNCLLIETDTPYLAPQSKRGQVNEPAFIVETAKVVAEVKGLSFDDFAKATTQNAKNIFRI